LDTTERTFHCEVERSPEGEPKQITVRCHGRLGHQTAGELRDTVKPLIPEGGSIVIDLTDVNYMDSLGLGTLVSLKASALNEGYCTLTLVNLSPRVQELLRVTHLTNLFSS
jgi:anti-anti-sigma factor